MPSQQDDSVAGNAELEDTSKAPTSVEAGTTKFGRDITINKVGNTSLWRIDVAGGGDKARELRGKFTKYELAENQVEAYIEKVKSYPSKKKPGPKPKAEKTEESTEES